MADDIEEATAAFKRTMTHGGEIMTGSA